MRKLTWFVLKSYLGPLVMTFFIALFILLMQFLWTYIDDLVGKGLDGIVVVKLLFFASVTFVPLALPLSILLSSLMMFGNLGENYELVAMKAAGISLSRIMRPLVMVTILISGVAFYFANNVLPTANLKFLSLLFDVREKKLTFNIKEGIFYNGFDGFVIRVGQKDKDGSTIRDVMIYDHTKHQGNVSVTLAESGKMELTPDKRFLIFRLFNGTNYEERIDLRQAEITRPFQRTKFREQFQKFDLTTFQLTRTDEKLFKKNYEMLNISQLVKAEDSLTKEMNKLRKTYSELFIRNYFFLAAVDTLKNESLQDTGKTTFAPDLFGSFPPDAQKMILTNAKNQATFLKENLKQNASNHYGMSKFIRKHQIVMHKKITFSIACFLLFFIGAPLGAIIRKGGLGIPAVISTIFFILFWVLSLVGEKNVAEGVLPVYIGIWIAPAVLLPIGIFLTYKATVDASLLDIEAWIRFFTRIFRIPIAPRT